MVYPVTGPFYKEHDRQLYGTYTYRQWYRQSKPYTERLPFMMVHKQVVSQSHHYSGASDTAGLGSDAQPSAYTHAKNKAYEKFKSRATDPASLAVSLAERKQSIDMIVNRAGQLLKFARNLNRGRLVEAADALGLAKDRRPKNLKKGSKTGGNLWLEYHFGWSPLVMDIGQAVDVLQRPVKKAVTIKGGGSSESVFKAGTPQGSFYYRHQAKVYCQMIADVEVSNPNLFLANELGFVNPATVAWELVPFSFLGDWFVNIGDILASMTDFVGLRISNPMTTYYVTSTGLTTSQPWDPAYRSWISASVVRSRGLESPSFEVRPFKGLSLARGVTAISLLLQSMK